MAGVSAVIRFNDAATPELRRQSALLTNRRALNAAIGKRAERELRLHFLHKEQSGANRQGWPRTHYWNRRIRASTQLTEVNGDHAIVEIADPSFALKLHGGTIVPKEAKFLAIPARSEAYGRSPRFFFDLHFQRTGPNSGILVQNGSTSLKGKKLTQGGLVFYFLVKSVTQQADRTALPSPGVLERALTEEARDFLERSRSVT